MSASSGSVHVPGRILLISEGTDDGCAAEVLRASGAAVTILQADDATGDPIPHQGEPGSLVVMASSRTGRALVDIAGRVAAARGDRMVVLVCDQVASADIRGLLHVGIRGIVVREHMAETLVPAVAAVASGQVCVPSQGLVGASRPVLSVREKQVIGLVAMGLMNVEIARRLFLAESTVKSHLSSAFAKLGVRSRHEAVELLLNPASGLGLGILSLDDAGAPAGSDVADLQ
jgi:DNA-binding NarL/FixJ family response regulator